MQRVFLALGAMAPVPALIIYPHTQLDPAHANATTSDSLKPMKKATTSSAIAGNHPDPVVHLDSQSRIDIVHFAHQQI